MRIPEIRSWFFLLPAAAVVLAAGVLVTAGCSSGDSVAATAAPDCSTGTISSEFASDVPAWISDNFSCVRVTMSGDDIVIQTRDLPPYESYYYPVGHTLNDSTPPTDTTNPNSISEQNFTFTIPSVPAIASETTESGLGEIGVAVDGVVIFNNEANAPDTLANEASTLDVNTGHPAEAGNYHYHVEMAEIVSTGEELVGIALDGFPIYGRFDEGDSTAAFTGSLDTEPSGGNWHEHATTLFTDGVPHYHIVEGFEETGTSGSNSGVDVELRYMVGSTMAGTKGTVTNQ